MAEQHPNVLHYIHAIQAFNENDLNTVKETTSENVVYRIAGRAQILFRGTRRDITPLSFNQGVTGSRPVRPTLDPIINYKHFANIGV
jgi:hypothetical protein